VQGVDRITPAVEAATERMSRAAVDSVDLSGAGQAAQRVLDQLDVAAVRGGDGGALGDYIASVVQARIGDITLPAPNLQQDTAAVAATAGRPAPASLSDDAILAELRAIRAELLGGVGGDVVINQEISTTAERAADEINADLRTLSALGAFRRR
jgi:hypothetical protein